MARKAFGSQELDRLQGFIVWIMTCTAPQPAIALARTSTPRKLLDVADDFEFLSVGSRGRSVAVRRENVLKPLARPKVTKILARVQYSSHSQQVTLLADAIPCGRFQFRWIDDRARRECRHSIRVRRARDV